MSKDIVGRKEELLIKAQSFPKSPGCYLMKNSKAEIIYVGKAKNLKNRVVSYFNDSAKNPKTEILVGHIVNIEFILTANESESYILENNLIKEHRPRYNIRLKDDKSYPYVSVNWHEAYPRLEYVRRPQKKPGVDLFGPFPVGSNLSEALKILSKAFKLRDCSLYEFNQRKTPCLLYQMHQCSAPCVGYKSGKEYQAELKFALGLFQGKILQNKVLEYLKKEMQKASSEERFEMAAQMRDYVFGIEDFLKTSHRQDVELQNDKNIDVIAFYKGETEVDISFYLMRQGMLLGQKNFHFLLSDFVEDLQEEITQFVLQYYMQNGDVLPQEIVINLEDEKLGLMESVIKTLDPEHRCKISKGTAITQRLMESVFSHAEECQRVRLLNQDSVYVGLNKLKELLGLKTRPMHLECYDIAIWQGQSPTAAQIVFYEGKADKTQYRHYHLATRPEGNNDFAMMQEVFRRRIKYGNLPDVFIVDGGIGQVNMARAVLDEEKILVPVIGIAKAKGQKEGDQAHERLIIHGRSNPYLLYKCPSLMKIIVNMRDEAHRFSRRLHHHQEKKRTLASWVDDIRGIGEETKQHIKNNLGITVEELIEFSVIEIQNYFGVELRHAKAIFEHLRALNKN